MPKSKKTKYKLDQSPFYYLQTKKKLANLLNLKLTNLKQLTLSKDLYTEKEFFDPQRNKPRLVEKPKPELKQVQKCIEELLKRIEIPNYIHGPAKGCSYVSNAKAHINSLEVRSLDIKKYFPSTASKRIYWFFHKRMKCSSDVAGILTKLSSYKEHLPTGSPLSPLLSYFAHIDMWEEINEIVELAGCTLTVYVDDVTISGTHVSDKLIWQIKKKFHGYGLLSNDTKEKDYRGKKSSEVTGVIIKKGILKLPNRQHKKMYEIRKEICAEPDIHKRNKLQEQLKGLRSNERQIKNANDIQADKT
ncbi:reverse transcriptase family protein [Okeanomitos corallinicola TIOX110]|uniref:Reverse transcriptase family protein n=1 Tax=Okeanomitos corallinicola TIOX110 TaxID=3133117 RepID=A0ABZ2URP4_9CYAN